MGATTTRSKTAATSSSTTTTTTTTAKPPTIMATGGAPVNPKDSMKSTWRHADKSTWNWLHYVVDFVDVHPTILDKPVPVFKKTDPVPHLPNWQQLLLVVVHAFIPILLHQAWLSFTGKPLGSIAAGIYYTILFDLIVVREVKLIRRLAYRYGYLDGDKHLRDEIPDVGIDKIAHVLNKVTGARIAMAIYFSYNPAIAPLDVLIDPKWWAWLLLEITIYPIILDFWFYVYHRCMHDIPFLWQFHRTHHLTKHPNALMSAYADNVQELFDIAMIPLFTYLTLRAIGVNLGFYEWWVCHQYIAYTEVGGHSGLRLHLSPPNPISPLLEMFGMELVVEDHDLHHRKGWRKSHNYGKQTRVWDKLFGTCIDRIESIEGNIDYVNQASIPII